MPQKDVIRTMGPEWDFLEPAMHPDYARTDHGVLVPAGAGAVLAYRKGQILRGKTDGSNLWAKLGTSGYAGPPRIMKYSVLINEYGQYQYTDQDAWDWVRGRHEGSIDFYYQGFFKTQDLIGAGGTNEVQTLTIDADVDGGTYTLKFGAYETAPIAYNALAADIENALDALGIFADGDVEVTGLGPFVFTFGGNYAGANVPLLVVDPSELTDGGGAVASDTTAVVETTPGAGLLTGIGKIVRGTSANGIMQLGVGAPA
jgi:hypothetical protein